MIDILSRNYSYEELSDIEEQMFDALNLALVNNTIPKDEFEYVQGIFKVSITWQESE